jgi:hypothetical protein
LFFGESIITNPNAVCFLYRKDQHVLVHESATVKGKEYYSNSHFYHYGYNDIDTLLNKTNKYSSLRAQEKFESGKKYSLTKLIFCFPVFFFKEYILGRLFLFGTRGFVKAMIGAFYAFTKEAKLYEMKMSQFSKK